MTLREQRGGGNRIISGGVQNRFGGEDLWYVFPSPEFPPPPLFFSDVHFREHWKITREHWKNFP